MKYTIQFWLALLLAPGVFAQEPDTVTVGVVAFEDFHDEFEKWNRILPDIGRTQTPALRFKLAVGTYGDLLHWLDKGLVDLAILTSGVFAESKADYDYLATIALPPATSKWANPERKQPGSHFQYCPVAPPGLISRSSLEPPAWN